ARRRTVRPRAPLSAPRGTGMMAPAPPRPESPSMTFCRSAAPLLGVLLAATAAAQNDQVWLTDGTVLQGVKVGSFDVRTLRYLKDGAQDSVLADQVAKVELVRFDDVYRRGLDAPDETIATARDQLGQKYGQLGPLG